MAYRVKRGCKRAVLSGQVVLIVAALAALVVFATQFTKPMYALADAQNLIQQCHLSVALSSWQVDQNNWAFDFTLVESPFSFNCKTIFTEITTDGIRRAGDSIAFKDKDNPESELKEAIMGSMRDCWYMYGEGKTKIQQAIKVDAYEKACIVCSDLIVDKSFTEKHKDGVKLQDMYKYAADTSMPQQLEGKTYLEYFLEGSNNPTKYPGNGVDDVSKITLGGEDTKYHQYSVVFSVSNYPDPTWQGVVPSGLIDSIFGWDSKVKANSGIVGCYVGGYDKEVTGYDAYYTCAPDSKKVPNADKNARLTFGKVMDGGFDFDIVPQPGDTGSMTPFTAATKTFPVTVSLMPTSELASTCKRLY